MRNKNFIKAFVFLFVVVVLLLSVNSIITFTGKVITESQSSVQNSNFMLDSFRRTNLESINSVNLHGEIPSSVTQINMNTFQEGNLFETESQEPSLNYSGFIVELKEEPRVKKRVELEELAKKNQEIIDTYPVYSPIKVLNLISGVDEKNLDIFIASAQQRQISEKEKVKSEVVNLVQEKINQGKNPLTGNAIFEDTQINPENIITAEFQELFNGFAINVDEETAREIGEIEGVKRVWPNMIVQATLMDSVPLIQEGIPSGQLDFEGNDCTISRKECLTGKGVKIAILDTGVDYTHPDLGGCTLEQVLAGTCEKVISGQNFVWENGFLYPNKFLDDYGHGTHCAATAAGEGVLKGVAPEAKILAYKVLNSEGSGTYGWILGGIEKSIENNADILSLSFGSIYGNPDDPLSQAVDNAVLVGKVVVVAAGNDGEDGKETIGSPGVARRVITVGAVTKNDFLAYFSSKGPVRWKNSEGIEQELVKPDVLAPGVSICAAQASQDKIWQEVYTYYDENIHCIDETHISISGTSMATPHVAGTAALLKQKNMSLSPEEIKQILKMNSIDLGLSIFEQGMGRINVSKSLREEVPLVSVNVFLSGDILRFQGSVQSLEPRKYYLEYFNRYSSLWESVSSELTSGEFDLEMSKGHFNNERGLFRIKTLFPNKKEFYYYFFSPYLNNFDIERVGLISPYMTSPLEQVTLDVNTDYIYPSYDIEIKKPFEEDWEIIYSSSEPLKKGQTITFQTGNFLAGKYTLRLVAKRADSTKVISPSFFAVFIEMSAEDKIKPLNFKVYPLSPSFLKGDDNYLVLAETAETSEMDGVPRWKIHVFKGDEEISLIDELKNKNFHPLLIYPLSDYGHIGFLPFFKAEELSLFLLSEVDDTQRYSSYDSYLRLGEVNLQGEYLDSWPYHLVEGLLNQFWFKQLIKSPEKNFFWGFYGNNSFFKEYMALPPGEKSSVYCLYTNKYIQSLEKEFFIFDNSGNLIKKISDKIFKEGEIDFDDCSYRLAHYSIYFKDNESEYLLSSLWRRSNSDEDLLEPGQVSVWDAGELTLDLVDLKEGKIIASKEIKEVGGDWIEASPNPLVINSSGEIIFVLPINKHPSAGDAWYLDNQSSEMYLLDKELQIIRKTTPVRGYVLSTEPVVLEQDSKIYLVARYYRGISRRDLKTKLIISDLEGNIVREFGQEQSSTSELTTLQSRAIVTGDINNDGITEIITFIGEVDSEGSSWIKIYNFFGELVREIEIPNLYFASITDQISLGDYDKNGKLDLSLILNEYYRDGPFGKEGNSTLYRFDLGYDYLPENLYWPDFYDSQNSRYYNSVQSQIQLPFLDVTAPIYSDANHSNTTTGQATEFSVLWGDETSLNPNGKYIFSTNNTGIWINDSEVKFSMTPIWANVTKTLVSQVGVTIGYRWYASDNASNWNSTPIYSFVTAPSSPIPIIDKTAPTYSNVGHQISLSNLKSTTIKFFSYWNDETSLNPNGQYIFSTNASGVWKNNSPIKFSITPSWANSTLTISTGAKVIGYKWYASDNASNWNSTQVYSLKVGNIVLPPENPVPVEPPKETPNPVEPPIEEEPIPIKPTEPIKQSGDVYPPTYMNVVHLNTYAGLPAAFSITWIDETSLTPNGEYIFSTDNSGQWVNDTPVKFGTSTSAIVGKSITVPVTKILTSQSGKTVSYRWYASDNSGNWRATETYSFVTKTNWRTLLSRVTGNIIRFFFKE